MIRIASATSKEKVKPLLVEVRVTGEIRTTTFLLNILFKFKWAKSEEPKHEKYLFMGVATAWRVHHVINEIIIFPYILFQ